MRRLTGTAISLLLVLGAAACRESEDVTFEPVTDAAGNVVTVVEPGEEPRRELRVRATAEDVDEVTQVQEMAMEMTIDGRSQSLANPTVEIDLRYEVDAVRDDGMEVTSSYDDVRVLDDADPRAVAQMRQSLEALRSATGHVTIAPRGSILEARMEGLDLPGMPGQMVEQLTSSMAENPQNLSLPFPVEAVGVGARWRVASEAEIGGLPVELTTTIELTELDADRAAGSIDQVLRFVPGEVDAFGAPATIISGELAGNGTIEWDLDGGIVPRSDITTSGTTVFEVDGTRAEQHQELRVAFVAR